MHKILWAVKRIQSMSYAEIGWRMRSLINALIEHMRIVLKLVPKTDFEAHYRHEHPFTPDFTVFHGSMDNYQAQWKKPLLAKADNIINHRISYFNLENHDLGTPIAWHKDHATGQTSSRKPILNVDYRDYQRNGDCKLVWEPNRHHQLVVLARAYQVSKELKYAQAVVNQLTSWLDANPYGYGMNWCNPLELGIRLINWVWAIDLIRDTQLFSGEFKKRILDAVFLHCRDVHGKFSRGSSANNHLVGEVAGVYIAAHYFAQFKQSKQWQRDSKAVLESQIIAQSFPDGASREHAFSYQFFVFQLYFFARQVGQWNADAFSYQFDDRLKKIALFIAHIGQGGEHFPMVGDQDDGYALDLGDPIHSVSALCALSNHVFPCKDFQHNIRHAHESYFWNFQEKTTPTDVNINALSSRAFHDSGYYLLQATSADQQAASLLFDCGQLGYTAIAAHGHADALSVIMRLNGQDLFVDGGTYDYYSFPQWRDHFRKTHAHNTITIDDVDQSVICGRFMWEKHAQSRCLSWQPNMHGGNVSGTHDGYQRLNAPVTHQRDLSLDVTNRVVSIVDTLSTKGTHEVALYFHLSEQCHAIQIHQQTCQLQLANNMVTIHFSSRLQLTTITGQPDSNPQRPSLGWVSRGYHQKTAITTLIARATINTTTQFKTRIEWTSIHR